MNQLSHAVGVYKAIRERIIRLEEGVDDSTLADTLEGLTDLHEVIAAIIRSALIDEAMVAGLKAHIQSLQERLERLAHRATERRRISRDAMVEVAIKKISAPDFTVSLRPGTPALMVVDEKAIPQPYWEQRDPKLNKLDLIADLKAGVSVPGAHLSNPEPVLNVRIR
jgi:hypothetical protein